MQMVDYALYYQSLGYSVIPISPQSKTPLIAFADKPPLKENEVKIAWREHPDANIALKTDSFFVIDIDNHNGVDGLSNLRNWEYAKLIPKTLQSITPSGGKHIFLKKRPDIQLEQNIGMLEGVDLKANNNNYVLVPPSNNAKGIYQWDKEHSPADGSMTEAPYKLLEALQGMKPSTPTPQYDVSGFTSSNYSISSKTAKLFEMIITGFGDEGGRNQTLAEFVGGLLFRGVDAAMAYELCKIANQHTPDPLPQKELDRTFRSMCQKEMRRRGGEV